MKSNQTKFNQYTLFNSLAGMDERSLNWLISTWAFSFRLFIYPLIRPELFDCLYSVVESRPATPPQVLVSLLLIGAIFNKTDDEMHDAMMAADMRIRFATNTMEIPQEKLPTCDKALSRFRERNRAYAREHNCESPLEVCLREVQFGMWALMGISMKNLRVDSTQISANIARLTRVQLLWRANARMLRSLPGMGAKKIEELSEEVKEKLRNAGLLHYYEDGDENNIIYHSVLGKTEKRQSLLKDVEAILGLCSEEDKKSENGKLYLRILSEQTVEENGKRRMATSADGTMHSGCVQNPTDPDATFRKKAGEEFIGYVLGFVEAVGPLGSQVVGFDFDRNVQSDPVMALAFMNRAKAIVEGIERYNRLFGIENPGNMEKCQQALQDKMELVIQSIREARAEGRHIPRANEFGFAYETADQADEKPDEECQQLGLEDLLSGLGVITVPVSKDNTGEGTANTPNNTPVNSDNGQKQGAKLGDLVKEAFDIAGGTKNNAATQPEAGTPGKQKTVQQVTDPLRVGAKVPVEGMVVLPDGWFINGVEGNKMMESPEFADLEPEVRREAILQKLRDSLNTSPLDLSKRSFMVGDGLYSMDELAEKAAEEGFVMLPTDLFGKKVNPIVGLFTFGEDNEAPVVQCPRGKVPQAQTVYANGVIRIQMPEDACGACPFRNDCKVKWQSRANTYAFTLSPSAKPRVLCEAVLRTEQFKDVGRFRNGVETIPSFLHNVLDIDNLPIGKAVKQTYVVVKMAALNVMKFFNFLQGNAHIASNPLLA